MEMTLVRARKMVRQYTAARDAGTVELVAKRMVDTGECVWHAAAQVTSKPCWCNDCRSAPRGSK